MNATRSALVLVAVLAVAPAASAQTKAGKVHSRNTSGVDCTVTCTTYYDGANKPKSVLGGSWTFKAGSTGWLKDQGRDIFASRFDYTVTTPEGSTRWYTTQFDREGNLHVIIDADLMRRHREQLRPTVAMRPSVSLKPGGTITKEAAGRALLSVAGAALAHEVAKKGIQEDTLGGAIAAQLALKVRDAAVENALKELFPAESARNIVAARQVICLNLDGKLTVRNLDDVRAKEELMKAIRRIDPDAGTAAEVVDFIHSVYKSRR